MDKMVSKSVQIEKKRAWIVRMWWACRRLIWVFKGAYWKWRYGALGKPRTMISVKKQLQLLKKHGFQKRLVIEKGDSAATQLTKAMDGILISMVGYTLNWCLGLVQEPPLEYLKRQMHARGTHGEVMKALEQVLKHSHIEPEALYAMLGEVAARKLQKDADKIAEKVAESLRKNHNDTTNRNSLDR